jgi:hypothetical protein
MNRLAMSGDFLAISARRLVFGVEHCPLTQFHRILTGPEELAANESRSLVGTGDSVAGRRLVAQR